MATNNNNDNDNKHPLDGRDPFSEVSHNNSKHDESLLRYAAYTARIKTILLSVKRYVAYSSDFGEAFRPIASPMFVRGAYGLSWAYVSYDVATEGMSAHKRGESNGKVAEVVVKRAVFQSLASMALPALTIHTQVRLASKLFGRIGRWQRWGPTIAGLAVMPALPFLFDHPVEHAVDVVFDKAFDYFRSPSASTDSGPESKKKND